MGKETYEKRLGAVLTITDFMSDMALRRSEEDVKWMWLSLSGMCRKYGEVFVAAAIEKSHEEAEQALMLYGHRKVALI